MSELREPGQRGGRARRERRQRRGDPRLRRRACRRGRGRSLFLWWLHGLYTTQDERAQTQVYPMAAGQQDQLPPEPRLQDEPAAGAARSSREATVAARRIRLGEQGSRRRAHPDRRRDADRGRARAAGARGSEMKTLGTHVVDRRPVRRGLVSVVLLLALYASLPSRNRVRRRRGLPAAERAGGASRGRVRSEPRSAAAARRRVRGRTRPHGADRRLLRQTPRRARVRLLRLPDALPAEPQQSRQHARRAVRESRRRLRGRQRQHRSARDAGAGTREESALRRAIGQAVDCERLALPDGHGGEHPAR